MTSAVQAAAAVALIWFWGWLGASVLWMLDRDPWWSALVAVIVSGGYLLLWMIAAQLATIAGAASLKASADEREAMSPEERRAAMAVLFPELKKENAEADAPAVAAEAEPGLTPGSSRL